MLKEALEERSSQMLTIEFSHDWFNLKNSPGQLRAKAVSSGASVLAKPIECGVEIVLDFVVVTFYFFEATLSRLTPDGLAVVKIPLQNRIYILS